MPPRISTHSCSWLLILPLALLTAAAPLAAQAPVAADTAKWITTNDSRWRAAYKRDIAEPFQKAIAELRQQYLASLTPPLAAATQAGRTDEAAALAAEREAVTSGEAIPNKDDPETQNTVKTLRKNYREQFARIDKQRFDRSRILFAQCDSILVKSQNALNERNRSDEADKMQQERDHLRDAWLKPPVSLTPAAAVAATTAGSPAPAKLTGRPLLEKLLALGATVVVKSAKGELLEVKPVQFPEGKYVLWNVSLPVERPDQTPLEVSDYAILDSLTELDELALTGENVTNAVIERLRAFHTLQNLTLTATRMTAACSSVFAALPELRSLYLSATGTTDEAMKNIAQCHKLKILHLITQPLGDEGMASLAGLSALEQLELSDIDNVGSPGFAHLAECRALKQIIATGLKKPAGLLENLVHCKNLEIISMAGSGIKDSDIAPLGALTKLRNMDLSGCAITGAGFATWAAHLQTTTLNLANGGGVDDAGLKNIEHAFPKLEELDAQIAGAGFSAAGVTALSHLRGLQTLNLTGAGVSDEMAAQIAHCDSIVTLSIRDGKLGDAGVASLARLPHLNQISLDVPPITGAALKSFSRCKELRTVYIGKDAPAETEAKIRHAAPAVAVHRRDD